MPEEMSADEETGDHAPPDPDEKPKKKQKQVQARPDIRAEPDARGRVIPRAQPVKPVNRKNFFQRFFGPKRGSQPPARERGR